MSLSTLQSQLAALHSSGGGAQSASAAAAGLTYRSSKRHGDAVGRGLAYSVQHGHALVNSTRYQASLLYPTAAAAADVPLSALTAHASDAVTLLSEAVHAPLRDLAAVWLTQSIEATTGGNADVDNADNRTTAELGSAISQTLTVVSSILGECTTAVSDPRYAAALDVLEYLLRRHAIHEHSRHAIDLLWALLPHADRFPLLLHRCLLLSDWAGSSPQSQSYLWLRPYCVTTTTAPTTNAHPHHEQPDGGGSAAAAPPLPPPHVIAARAFQHLDVLRTVCAVARSAAALHRDGDDGDGDDRGSRDDDARLLPRRGVAVLLSYTAALIVQGLAGVQRNHRSNNGDDDAATEAVVRTLLPTVAAALQPFPHHHHHNADWTAWGYVVASALAERVALAPSVTSLLGTKVVQAAAAASAPGFTAVEARADAIACLLSIVLPHRHGSRTVAADDTGGDGGDGDCYIPLLVNDKLLGCPLPIAVYTALLAQSETLPAVLGHLYTDRRMVVSPLVAAVIGRALSDMGTTTTEKRNKKKAKTQQTTKALSASTAVHLVVGLIQHEGLRGVWRDPRTDLTASLAAMVLLLDQRCATTTTTTNSDVPAGRAILSALHGQDAAAAERGIAFAVLQVVADRKIGDGTALHQEARLAALLDGIVPVDNAGTNANGGAARMLPPRLALEHADPAVRLQAVERLVDSRDTVVDDSLLLRAVQHVTDPHAAVAAAVCAALALWWERGVVRLTPESAQKIVEVALAAVRRYSPSPRGAADDQPPARLPLLLGSLTVVAYLARDVARWGRGDLLADSWQPSVEVLGALMAESQHAATREHAAALVAIAFDHHEPVRSPTTTTTPTTPLKKRPAAAAAADSLVTARRLLVDCDPFLRGLLVRPSRTAAAAAAAAEWQRACGVVVLGAMLEALGNTTTTARRHELAGHALALCLDIVEACEDKNPRALGTADLTRQECDVVQKCLETSLTLLPTMNERAPEILIALASTESRVCWVSIADPAIHCLIVNIRDRRGKQRVSAFTVLFEAALRPQASSVVVKRILATAISLIASGADCGQNAPWLAVPPALALLESADQEVRVAAASLLQAIEAHLPQACKGRKTPAAIDWSCLKTVCRQISIAKSSATMGGDSFLPDVLSKSIGQSPNAAALQETLLTLCVLSAGSYGGEAAASSTNVVDNGWLSLENAAGGCRTAAALLKAMALAGEETFPLQLRWKFAGRKLLDAFVAVETKSGNRMPLDLAACIVGMLKGVTNSDPSVIISTGPRSGRGGRARSYSVGKMDGVSFLTPYPDDMARAIVEVLSKCEANAGAKILAAAIARDVLESKTWGEAVFKTLAASSRKKIAAAILRYVGSDAAQGSERILVDLPLTATDIIELMGRSDSNAELQNDSILADIVRANADALFGDPDAPLLVALLFRRLTLYAADTKNDGDGIDFVCRAVLVAIGNIIGRTSEAGRVMVVDSETLERWTCVLLSLLGGGSAPRNQRSFALRSRAAALVLLVALCSQFPARVVASLVPAALSAVVASNGDKPMARVASATFSAIVPAYITHAPAGGLSLTHLLNAFFASVATLQPNDQKTMYTELAVSLATERTCLEPATDDPGTYVGALQACYLANESNQNRGSGVGADESDAIGFAVGMLEYCSAAAKTTSLLLLLGYAKGLMCQFLETPEKDWKSNGLFLPTPCDIGVLAAVGPSSAKQGVYIRQHYLKTDRGRKHIRGATLAILRAFSDGLMLESVRNFIQTGVGAVSGLSLRLWRDLLLIQSAAQMPVSSEYQGDDGDDAEFQESVLSLVNESRDFLQSILPPHVFLASVSSLIQDGGTVEIRSQALRLVADRAVTVPPGSPEASLFVDILPIVLDILNNTKELREEAEEDLLLMQSALVSVEHIARVLIIKQSNGSEFGKTPGFQFLISGLQQCCRFLSEDCERRELSSSVCDLIATAALCGATLIRVVGAACLPLLPRLMHSLCSVLSTTTSHIASTAECASDQSDQRRKATQLSILRALGAIVETVPQFVPPYLPLLLTGSAVLSGSLRSIENDASIPVMEAVALLCTDLSTRVAPRTLIPAASKSLALCARPSEIVALLTMLKSSTEHAGSSIIAAQSNTLLSSVTTSFEYQGAWNERSPIVVAACDLFDALVLKLSEAQLRRVYASIREWRGGLDRSDPEILATRRFAFWAVSARLSKGLRSIFLPCLSVVMDDVTAELDLAVVNFEQRRSSTAKTAEGTRMRKLDDAHFGMESMRALQPLLATLENALRADAFQGGRWVRDDDNVKYEALLEPIGKLLLSRIPADFPIPGIVTEPYQYVVEGVGDGSVIGCLTSLAAAGGNEQLWKPLNHAVLRACGDESRSHVRRAGLVCLLELMKALGEEYMVLLPENLPVLAELLEDSNEEVASLAKEVVTMAEELIGESLGDSLR